MNALATRLKRCAGQERCGPQSRLGATCATCATANRSSSPRPLANCRIGLRRGGTDGEVYLDDLTAEEARDLATKSTIPLELNTGELKAALRCGPSAGLGGRPAVEHTLRDPQRRRGRSVGFTRLDTLGALVRFVDTREPSVCLLRDHAPAGFLKLPVSPTAWQGSRGGHGESW
jgi:hypothetical protein